MDIQVCVDFQDLNIACPKDDFPLPITELMVNATTTHESLSFMDGSSGYNQIRMAPQDEEFIAFCISKGIYYYKLMSFDLKNVGATYHGQCKRSLMICSTKGFSVTLMILLSRQTGEMTIFKT